METPPPNYAQYPRGNNHNLGGGMPYRTPGIYFDYISIAFKMITRNAGVYVLGAFVVLIVFYAITIPFSLLANYISYGSPLGAQNIPPDQILASLGRSMPISMATNILPGALFYMMFTGISLCAIEEADTGTTSFNTLFKGFNNFGTTFVSCILLYVVQTIGMYLCCLPFFLVAGFFAFVPIIAATEGLSVGANFAKSSEYLKPFFLPMAGLYLVATFLGGLGVCACLVGVLFTFPILYVVIGLHYRDFRNANRQGSF